MMKSRKTLAVIMVTSLMLGSYNLYAQTAEELLPKAIQLEEVNGDLEEAIKTYQLIINQYPDNGKVCAEALLHMGNCYEKLGKAEAIKSYELILKRYSEQTNQVKAARARLAVLKKEEPEGFMVKKMDFNVPEPFGLSPDGTKIVGVRFGKGQNIVVSHLDKDKVDYITNYDWENEYSWTYNPVWSPDGKEIVYTDNQASADGEGESSLTVSDLNGQTRKLISSNWEWFAPNDWMSDGSAILTFKGDTANTLELGLVSANGGDFRKLVTLQGQVQNSGSSRAAATFSPDGKFVVYTDISPGEESDLYIMDSEGKSSRTLNSHPAADKWPRWSPDGKHIIFLSNRHGGWALWGTAVDDGETVGDPFLIREGMGNNFFGNWTTHGLVSWNWVRMRDIFLLDVDPETGEPKGKSRQLNYTPSGNNNRPVFAPDGNRLAFIRRDTDAEKDYLIVHQTNEETFEEFEIPKGFTARSIRWNPDGNGVGIHCVNLIADHEIKIFHIESQKWESISVPFPIWTFEWSGKTNNFYFSKNGLKDLGAGIVEYNPETGEEQYIYRPEDNSAVNFRELRCSRDYSKLAFLETNLKMIVVDLKSGVSQTIAEYFGYSSWSVDGQKIMSFGPSDKNDQRKSLAIFSANGGVIEYYDLSNELAEDCEIYIHDWSANGSKVIFVTMQGKSEHMLYKNIVSHY